MILPHFDFPYWETTMFVGGLEGAYWIHFLDKDTMKDKRFPILIEECDDDIQWGVDFEYSHQMGLGLQ